MTEWKDTRKNIYTLIILNRRAGYVVHVETHSNKKKAEARRDRMQELWIDDRKGTDTEGMFAVEMTTTKLERKSRWA